MPPRVGRNSDKTDKKTMRLLASLLLGVCAATAVAQTAGDDPVLMSINGRDVLRSEFEHIYNKNKALEGVEQKTMDEYVSLFVDFKLKVAAAESEGLDTTQAFRDELAGYRRNLAKSYLTDEAVLERQARDYYDRACREGRARRVRLMQVFCALSPNASAAEQRAVSERLDSVWNVVQGDTALATFEACVERVSADGKATWVRWGQTTEDFENRVLTLRPGQMTAPFATAGGMHIVRVLEREEAPAFEKVRDELVRRVEHSSPLNPGVRARVEQLKQKYGYEPIAVGLAELEATGRTKYGLFTLAGKTYTGDDFDYYIDSRPSNVKRQYEWFVTKTVLDYENRHLEENYPEFRLLMQEYRDGMLLFEISNREVWERASVDTLGLAAYYDSHAEDYYWPEPRFCGVVLQCASRRVMRRARKHLKQLHRERTPEGRPAAEAGWLEQIPREVKEDGRVQVRFVKGEFAPGDNAYVDRLVFGRAVEPSATAGLPHAAVVGDLLRGPQDYREVQGLLVGDYQAYLEQQWLQKLRSSAKVEINQEVLKTVNNHGGKE